MKKIFFNKSWVVGLTILFIVGSLTSNIVADDIGSPIMGTTWYIDDDAIPPYDGTLENPFRYIWQGIENATSGANDILTIASGLYQENVIIDKEDITINKWKGEDLPIIDGGYEDCVIEIQASGVQIIEMKIIAGGKTARDAGIFIEEGTTDIKVLDCDISDCFHGIWSQRTDADEIFHTYSDNNIHSIMDSGILAHFSDELEILSNTVTNCGYCGILLMDCENCVISENVCENNHYGIGIDVGRKNEISENTCKDNDNWGFYIVNGLLNTIKLNNFLDNGQKGQATWVEYRWLGGNQWTNNYWGRPGLLIHIIGGSVRRGDVDIPWFRVDLFPSSSPN